MIDENRKNHMFAVANLMKQNSKHLGLDDKKMFTLGLVHDVGYEFVENHNHNKIGADILSSCGYEFANEVRFHGDVNPPYSSLALDLLNWCDMQIDSKGEKVSFEQRLKDIEIRYGKNSTTHKNAKQVVQNIQNLI